LLIVFGFVFVHPCLFFFSTRKVNLRQPAGRDPTNKEPLDSLYHPFQFPFKAPICLDFPSLRRQFFFLVVEPLASLFCDPLCVSHLYLSVDFCVALLTIFLAPFAALQKVISFLVWNGSGSAGSYASHCILPDEHTKTCIPATRFWMWSPPPGNHAAPPFPRSQEVAPASNSNWCPIGSLNIPPHRLHGNHCALRDSPIHS